MIYQRVCFSLLLLTLSIVGMQAPQMPSDIEVLKDKIRNEQMRKRLQEIEVEMIEMRKQLISLKQAVLLEQHHKQMLLLQLSHLNSQSNTVSESALEQICQTGVTLVGSKMIEHWYSTRVDSTFLEKNKLLSKQCIDLCVFMVMNMSVTYFARQCKLARLSILLKNVPKRVHQQIQIEKDACRDMMESIKDVGLFVARGGRFTFEKNGWAFEAIPGKRN